MKVGQASISPMVTVLGLHIGEIRHVVELEAKFSINSEKSFPVQFTAGWQNQTSHPQENFVLFSIL